jgi:hypothetical protein
MDASKTERNDIIPAVCNCNFLVPRPFSMHPLQRKVAAARRRIRRLLVLYGLGRVVAVVIAAIAVLALADYLLRFDDRGVRWICSLALLAASIWALLRYLLPALRQPLRDVVVAGRVERHFAGMGDHLSSTIEFLRQREDDPFAGSAELRRAAVAQAEAEIAPLDWRAAIDRRPAVLAAAVACGIGLIAGALVIARPADARLALARLANPLSNAAWPPKNDLAFIHPVNRVALGQPFEVELKDNKGNLPDAVKIHYRMVADDAAGGGAAKLETEPMQRIGDLMVARKERVAVPFDYRAEGGDDHKMAWIHVDIVQPPRIDSLAITLHPPAYTGWPSSPGERRIVALRGTVVEMTGRSNKPLASATLHAPSRPDVPGVVSADGLSFTIPLKPAAGEREGGVPSLTIDRSGPYWFELRDREGLVGGESDRWDIQAIVDQSPSVSFSQPAANLLVLPAATVVIKVVAKDDLALHSVVVSYTRSDRTDLGEITIMPPLFPGPDHLAIATAPVLSGTMPGDIRTFDFAWRVEALKLKPGTNLLLTATAADYASQRTTSSPRRISIITPEEFDDHLAARESVILNELSRILKLQQSSRQETTSLETQLGRLGRLAKADLEQLRAEELNQRQVRRGLVSPAEGVRSSVVALLQELASNHVDNPALQRRMQGIADGLARLDQNELSSAEQSLTAALKAAEDASESAPLPPAVRQSLADAGRLQESIAAALEALLGDLAEWNSFRGLARQLAQIRRDQADLEKSTKEIGAATLTNDVHTLSPQQQADLKKLGDREVDLARQLDKVMQRMEQVGGQLSKTEPQSAESLSDALDIARRQAPGGQMRDAADAVNQNRIGQALGQQASAGAVLDEMLDILVNRRNQELSRLVAKLHEAEQQLANLRKDQDGLRKRLKELAAASDAKTGNAERKADLERLARQQHDLQEQAEHLTRQLQRLQAQRAADAMAQAAAAMNRASQAAEKGDAAEADSNAAGAQKDLDDAQRQLAETLRKAAADLAHQQLARLEDSLKGLVDVQQRSLDDTIRLEKRRNAEGELTRGEAQSVLDLGRQQRSLSTDADQLAAKLVGAESFQFVLQAAAREMSRTAARLSDRNTGAETQQLEQDVLQRLQELIAAMKQDHPAASSQPGGKTGPNGGGGNSDKKMRSLAEVQLIRLMQDDLNRRTHRLDEAIGPGRAPSEAQRHEFSDLTEEQGHLAELMIKLTGDTSDDPPPTKKDPTP